MTRAARFAAAFVLLDVAHDVADHVLQTDEQALGKAEDSPAGWANLAGHIGSYTAAQLGAIAALSAVTDGRPTCGRTVAAVAFSALSHAFLDRRWPVRVLLERTGSAGFAHPEVQVRGSATPSALRGRDPIVAAAGPLPLHGPYLADQALHRLALAVAAWWLSGRR